MKLYWRIKINGKWTYQAAEIDKEFFTDPENCQSVCVFKPIGWDKK